MNQGNANKNTFNLSNLVCGRAWKLPTTLTVQKIITSGSKYASFANLTASLGHFALFINPLRPKSHYSGFVITSQYNFRVLWPMNLE